MANCAKIKMNEKVMRLRSSTLTVGNLAMIFKLDVNQGIYICREGEIIIPRETGFFNVGDYAKTYVVNRVEEWGKNAQAERAFHFAGKICWEGGKNVRTSLDAMRSRQILLSSEWERVWSPVLSP